MIKILKIKVLSHSLELENCKLDNFQGSFPHCINKVNNNVLSINNNYKDL